MRHAPRLWLLVAALVASPAPAFGQGRVVRDSTLGSGPLDVGAGIDPLGQQATYLITPDGWLPAPTAFEAAPGPLATGEPARAGSDALPASPRGPWLAPASCR